MKKALSLLAIFLIINIASYAQNNFTFKPEKPKPGEKITFTFNPSDTKLSDAESITMFVHAYGKFIYSTEESELKKNGGVFNSEFSVADSCAGVVIRFVSGEGENAVVEYFPIRFYGEDGKIIKYASAGLAFGYSSWFRYIQLEADPNQAVKLFEEEFNLYPDLRKGYLTQFYSAYSKVEKEKANQFIKEETEKYEKTLSQSLEDLSFLMDLYSIQKMNDKVEKIKVLIKENYPLSPQAEMLAVLDYRQIKEVDKKLEFANKFKENFPQSRYLSLMFPDPTNSFIQAGKYEEAYEALKKNTKASSGVYNSLSWAMYEKDNNLTLAKEIAFKGIELSKTEDPFQGSPKPPYYSDKQLKKMLGNSRYAILDTYGAILLKLGEYEEASKYLEEAFNFIEGKDAEVNERYSQSLVAIKKFDTAKTILEKCIADGQSTAKMKDLLKEVFLKSGSNESAFEKYFSELNNKAMEKTLAELKKKIINQPAPTFTLEDFEGNKVSLAALKGKTVIIDFWATWCGPCLASFPGMQKAVNKFASDPNVKFLFVNTWERVENKKKNAADFISKNNYTFHVLMDYENKVIESYKVEGIPTKFIIDKNGNIRFKSVGFSGSDEKLVDELSAMISMVQ